MYTSKAQEEESFLDNDIVTNFGSRCSQTSQVRHYLNRLFEVAAIISFIANIWFFSRGWIVQKSHLESDAVSHMPFSPADNFIDYHVKHIDTHDPDDRFVGPPDDDFHEAWEDLLAPLRISVTPEEMRKADKQSLRLRDVEQESYVGYLEVYHQLHCIKRLIQMRWPEKYPHLVVKGELSDFHFQHCIQVLRKGAMCSADTSLNTFEYVGENLTQIVGNSKGTRKCVNWEHLDGWARTRALGYHYDSLSADEDGYFGPQ